MIPVHGTPSFIHPYIEEKRASSEEDARDVYHAIETSDQWQLENFVDAICVLQLNDAVTM